MDLIYLAHPVRPLEGSTVDSNLDDAEWWLRELQRANPEVAIIAPWIQELRLAIGNEASAEDRARGLARCRAAAKRCDGVLLCGPRISSGMHGELDACAHSALYPVIHRFADRRQVLELPPRHRIIAADFSVPAPWWLERCRFGAVPQSAELVGAEILAAIDDGERCRVRLDGVAPPRLPLIIEPGSAS